MEYVNALRGATVADDGLDAAVLPIVPFLRKVGSAVHCHGACLSVNALADLAFMSLFYYRLFLFCKSFNWYYFLYLINIVKKLLTKL